jgi:hypothetical protein
MTSNKQPYVSIKHAGIGKVSIDTGFTIFHEKIEGEDRITCAIPAFDIYYSVKDESEVRVKGKTMTKIFFDNFIIHNDNQLKAFVLELHKLGFRAPKDAFVLKEFLSNKIVNSKFSNYSELDEDVVSKKSETIDKLELAF